MNFFFGKNVLAEVSNFRYLRTQMDNRLKFESHINNNCGKLAKINGLLIKGRNYFSKNVLVNFYNSYAKPLISHGLITFGATSKSLLEKVFVMLKLTFKTICFKRNFEHASYILHSFEIDSSLTYISDKYSKKLLINFVVKLPLKFLIWNL